MSNKPVINPEFHDGTAPNCSNFTTVVGAVGRTANLDRTCPHPACANNPGATRRRGRRKAVRP